MFGWFKSSNESKPTQEGTWDAATMTMRQPSNTEEMAANKVVSQQPVRPHSRLRQSSRA